MIYLVVCLEKGNLSSRFSPALWDATQLVGEPRGAEWLLDLVHAARHGTVPGIWAEKLYGTQLSVSVTNISALDRGVTNLAVGPD